MGETPALRDEDLQIGDRVQKVSGYRWPGIIVSRFCTLGGKWRFVVECTAPDVAGALHIYNREQLQIVSPACEEEPE